MGQGIYPVWKASKRGGLKIAKSGRHIAGLFNVALQSGDSTNPFQNPGLGEWMIFGLLDETTFTPVQDRVREIFDDFEEQELAILQKRPDNLTVFQTDEGEAAMLVYAVNLETNDSFSLSVQGTVNGLSANLIG
jgi:hypothetical protein